MVHPPSTKKVFCGSLFPTLPLKGQTLRPRESIILPLPTFKEGQFFEPPRCTTGGEETTFTEGPPWDLAVQGAPSDPQQLRITNTTGPCFLHLRLGQFGQPNSWSRIIQSHPLTPPSRKTKEPESMTKSNWTRNSKNLNINYMNLSWFIRTASLRTGNQAKQIWAKLRSAQGAQLQFLFHRWAVSGCS